MTSAEYVRQIIQSFITENPVDVNYLAKNDGAVSITSNGQTRIERYIEGYRVANNFIIQATKKYEQSIEEQQTINRFFANLCKYLLNHFDGFSWDENHTVYNLEITNSGSIVKTEGTMAKWQMSFTLYYTEREV